MLSVLPEDSRYLVDRQSFSIILPCSSTKPPDHQDRVCPNSSLKGDTLFPDGRIGYCCQNIEQLTGLLLVAADILRT